LNILGRCCKSPLSHPLHRHDKRTGGSIIEERWKRGHTRRAAFRFRRRARPIIYRSGRKKRRASLSAPKGNIRKPEPAATRQSITGWALAGRMDVLPDVMTNVAVRGRAAGYSIHSPSHLREPSIRIFVEYPNMIRGASLFLQPLGGSIHTSGFALFRVRKALE
jgi:hypothetical protein